MTIVREEHVLGTAQADAFGAEVASALRVARDVRVGADAEVAAEFVGPLHERGRSRRARRGSLRRSLAEIHIAGGAVDRNANSPCLHDRVPLPMVTFLLLVDLRSPRADDAGTAHAARHDGRVASSCRRRAVRMPLATCMPLDVVGGGLFADQDDRRALRGERYGILGSESRHRRRPRRGWRTMPCA